MCAACDQGHQNDQPHDNGPAVHLVSSNVGGSNAPLSTDGRIVLTFDRLLMPSSPLRQTFSLRDLSGNSLAPQVLYDPVARQITIRGDGDWLQADQTYRLDVNKPSGPRDPNGVRAIDGAAIDHAQVIEFPVKAGKTPPSKAAPDFCADVLPIFQQNCGTSLCHGGPDSSGYYSPAEGLLLTTAGGVAATAIGRVSQESNTGPRSGLGVAAGLRFGIDMPLVDRGLDVATGGDPGNSWVLYKVMMAADPPIDPALAGMMPGREMPFPADPATQGTALSQDRLETISAWIQAAARVPPSCP